jgi:hypothetical protein
MRVRLPGDQDPRYQPAPDVETGQREAFAFQNSLAVRCSCCRREIPRSAAINPEAGDYALYFCGLNCYREWLTDHEWIRPRRGS